MEYPFDTPHAGIESQVDNLPAGIPDSETVEQAKAMPHSVKNTLRLGKRYPVSFATGRPSMPIRKA